MSTFWQCLNGKAVRLVQLMFAFNVVFSLGVFWMLLPPPEGERRKEEPTCPPCHHPVSTRLESTMALSARKHILAVVVPFRDRLEELLQFVPHMHKYLKKKDIRFQIWVVNQDDRHRFNRGALINIGFLLSRRSGCTYMAMHDVDLLPLNLELDYSYPRAGPFHVAAPKIHPLYHYQTFVGGILIMSNTQFELVNGLSTRFWGWGREDDELFRRLQDAELEIDRPENLQTDKSNTFRHLHDSKRRKRDYARIGEQKTAQWKRDRVTGLSTMESFYTVKAIYNLTIGGNAVRIVNAELKCDVNITPWCDST